MPTFVTEVEFSLCAKQQILLKLNRYIFFFAVLLFLSFSTLHLAKKTHLQPNKIWLKKKPSYHKNDVLGFRVIDIVFIGSLQLYPGFLPFIN